ncbi:response regulator [Paenibacillus tianjinensis]|uniref:Response regulator n=1 Tax=Paenibacillus tianjinensis TaxID=2810347 RepID=A0ABX7LEZ8_9BACL|nr:response regulator [Paenibacillus tianjinensis]QSF45055.1 response regulator [Paenibacillus tianjinensis]
MYRVLIVDDQYFALLGLQQGVNWSALSVTEVCLAENVDHAIACLEQHSVDLLICDIEMPGRSGLELLAWVKQYSPGTLTIMLTCHADFEYAQQAIQHGAFHYLLKPVDYDELMRVASKAITEINKQKEHQQFEALIKDYRRKWEHQLPLLVERFWQDILSERASPVLDSLQISANTYDLDLKPDDCYVIALLGLEQWKENLSARDETIMEYALRNLAEELLLAGMEGAVLQDQVGHNLAIVYVRGNGNSVSPTLEQNCRTFLNTCEQMLHCSLSIYISPAVLLPEIMSAYTYVTEREQRNLIRSRQVFTPDYPACNKPLDSMPVAAPMNLFGEWATILELGELGELERRVQLWFSNIEADHWTNELHRQLIHGILFIIHTVLAKKGLSAHESAKLKYLMDKENYPKQSVALQNWAMDCLRAALQLLQTSNNVSSTVVTKIRQYIRSRLSEEITRDELAAHVYLNPAYLSRLFKKETGLSMSDVIIQERLQKAKRLLEETELKITDIAEQVGYTSLGSFSNLFKRVVGVTPQQYRARKKN